MELGLELEKSALELADGGGEALRVGDRVRVRDPRGWVRFEGFVAEIAGGEVLIAAAYANDIQVWFPLEQVSKFAGRSF